MAPILGCTGNFASSIIQTVLESLNNNLSEISETPESIVVQQLSQ